MDLSTCIPQNVCYIFFIDNRLPLSHIEFSAPIRFTKHVIPSMGTSRYLLIIRLLTKTQIFYELYITEISLITVFRVLSCSREPSGTKNTALLTEFELYSQ